MEEVQKYEGKQPIKKKSLFDFITWYALLCGFPKDDSKTSNHSCPTYPANSGISDGLVGANFSGDHDVLLEEKWCWVPWGQLPWEVELIWYFVVSVLATVHRRSLCPIKQWEKRPGKSCQVFCIRESPKVRFQKKCQYQKKRWGGWAQCGERCFVVTESQELHTLE